MQCTFKLSPADQTAFEKAVKTQVRLWIVLVVPVLIPLIVTSLSLMSNPRTRFRLMHGLYRPSWGEIASYAVPALVFPLLFAFFLTMARRKAKQDADSAAPITIQTDNEGISGSNDKGRDTIFWLSVHKIIETDAHFFVLNSPQGGLIIPKRAFDSPAQCAEFGALLQSKWAQHHPDAAPIAEAK